MAINIQPDQGIRIPSGVLKRFLANLFEAVGTSHQHADIVSEMLVESDLRGIFSHGSALAASYITKMLNREVNPRPEISVVRSGAMSRVIDGDGGLGHIACHVGTEWAIKEAKKSGLAGFTSRNHFHFGAAGVYTRMASNHDCIGMAISARRISLDPSKSILGANSGPPISVAVPTDRQPPLVMDMGVVLPWDENFFAKHRAVYLKGLAMGAVLQALGGILAGIYRSELQSSETGWLSDQGAFILVADVAAFMPVEEFKREMDRFVGEARKMRPLPDSDRADLAGGPEWLRYKNYSQNGIPINGEHQHTLEQIASRFAVKAPFEEYEHTRFKSRTQEEPAADFRKLIDTGRRIFRRMQDKWSRLSGA